MTIQLPETIEAAPGRLVEIQADCSGAVAWACVCEHGIIDFRPLDKSAWLVAPRECCCTVLAWTANMSSSSAVPSAAAVCKVRIGAPKPPAPAPWKPPDWIQNPPSWARYAFVMVVALAVGLLSPKGCPPFMPKPPDTKPEPGPTPVPQPGKLKAVMVYESTATLTREHQAILHSPRVREYLDAHCSKSGTQPNWRAWDKDVKVDRENEDMRKLWEAAIAKSVMKAKLPAFVLDNGKILEIVPFPANEEAALELLRKWGG